MFKDSASDIDELTVSVCSYISFCEDTVIPERPVKVYPNNNPCVTKALKNVLERKYGAFLQSDEAEKREARRELRAQIKRAKLEYKHKLEEKLSRKILKAAWDLRLTSDFHKRNWHQIC